MKCPDCGMKIERLPCEFCAREAARREREYQELIKEFSLVRGAPDNEKSQASLNFALRCIKKRVRRERFKMTVSYKEEDLLHSKSWWYVPHRWIGCNGFVVNKDDGYVNWLGSALTLRHCFWGHEHGVMADLVDFTFSPDTDMQLAARLLARFKHTHPKASARVPSEPVWYRESEIAPAVVRQFPTFKRHFVWFAIPELLKAYEAERLRFTSRVCPEAE